MGNSQVPTPQETLALVPAPRSDFTELARTKSGKLFRKQLLKKGVYPHPADPSKKLVIDDAVYDKLIANFNAGVCDIVQVPVANDQNAHVEDPFRNIGEVVKVSKEDGELYGYIDARDEDAAKRLGKTLLGTSAMMHLDYLDTKTGKHVGPTLLHALVTNRPYITGMGDYEEVSEIAEEVVAASADTSSSEPVVFMTREEDNLMSDKDKLIEELKEHGIDVVQMSARLEALEAEQSQDPNEIAREVLKVVKASVPGIPLPEDEGEITNRDLAEAVIELANESRDRGVALQELQNEREVERAAAAEREVDGLIAAKRILPTQKAGMLKLAREDHDTFLSLVPDKPIVPDGEVGFTAVEEVDSEGVEEAIARLSAVANAPVEGFTQKRPKTFE